MGEGKAGYLSFYNEISMVKKFSNFVFFHIMGYRLQKKCFEALAVGVRSGRRSIYHKVYHKM